ncbi:putative WD repeat-containing protein [Wickerhamomyces ciferrii]|uniref:WD repeat-containing protein n=1 Tax=Wickerhamomyces ciferrii (strain ATCC 14091 / BCRC 22168 / CBS 111 / JCM 3599 / NBRC 0793 / NRRL Y-1031 F-60-10) TaxID=1206466 RepID=K0KRD5_WICCF|nr:putative WD repeat-containing protein [Wickerhamomyces ciferrii]CCH43834.1 putative WD repeat-containing protein [Wickerhamomyces ciferrii]
MSTTEEVKLESHTSQYIENEKLINEEFKIWKKSVPLLYDTIQTYVQDTPSLTIETLPNLEFSNDQNEVEAKFLLGTYSHHHHGGENSENYLKLASIKLPSTLTSNFKKSIPIPTGSNSLFPKFQILQKWLHPNEVNKARFNKFNSKIATFTKSGDIKIWDFKNEKSIQTLKFHEKDGFGLEWGINNENLLTGGEDSKIALWDLSQNSSELKPIKIYETHDSIINDFSWNHKITSLFGSVSDDRSIQFFDTRSQNTFNPLIKISNGHKDVINAIEFNPVLDSIFVTGSADNLINVWDLRNTESPIRSLYGHNNAISQLKFNPENPKLLASSSNDRRIAIWDLNKIDEEFDSDDYIKNDSEDPTLVFIHGGHTSKISEFSWIQGINNTIISSGEDCLVQIWKPHLLEDDEESEEEEEQKEEETKE